ncbi:DUF1490 family protein [Amycolatopsis sp. NBC_01488]|uniref:DUF1490 family protein n=1 Tax=Amycolatopsis sp. NBC_01488 TaxID=2903563 RepID=UPI002E289D51|nr:DUF1490 family protein [Amycolatopsis sp. NBC_01488]
MVLGGIAAKAVGVVVTGVAGAAVYDGVKRVARSGVFRSATVTVTAWGLKGARAAETGAEKVRLATADVLSEARERIGEQAPVPGAQAGHGHEH